jgi:hypothetical protein
VAAKKKIKASHVYVGNITVKASLLSLAEQMRINAEQAERDRAQMTQMNAQMTLMNAEIVQIMERLDRNEHEIHVIAQAMMAMAQRMDARLTAVEQAVKPAAS